MENGDSPDGRRWRYRRTRINCNQDERINQRVGEGGQKSGSVQRVASSPMICYQYALGSSTQRLPRFCPRLLPQLSPLSKAHYPARGRRRTVVWIGRGLGGNFSRIFSTFGHEETISIAYVNHDTTPFRRILLQTIEKLTFLHHLSNLIPPFLFPPNGKSILSSRYTPALIQIYHLSSHQAFNQNRLANLQTFFLAP